MIRSLALVLILLASVAGAEQPQRVAFLGIVFLNTSAEPTSAEEEARRVEMERQLRERLEASGRYSFVDTAPVAEKADLYANIANCNGCDAALAAELGADLALTAEIQKTSNLILHITIYLREAGTGTLVGGGSADIRGNTDESWSRGIRYIVKNRILR